MADQHPGNDKDAVDEASPQGAEAVPPAAAPDGAELTDEQLGKVAGGKVPESFKGVIKNIRG